MSLFDILRRARTVAATAFLSWWRPRGSEMPAPTDEQIVRQPRGTLWCGPAAVTAVERALTGRPGALSTAQLRTPNGIMGTWRGDQTSVEAVIAWLPRRGLRVGDLQTWPAGRLFDAAEAAARGDAYSILLIWADGSRQGVAGVPASTHFVVACGVRDGRLLLADSIDRGPEAGGHRWSIPRADAPRWAVPVTRFGELTPLILVRRA